MARPYTSHILARFTCHVARNEQRTSSRAKRIGEKFLSYVASAVVRYERSCILG